jgi:hypothetical protein
MCVQAKCTSQHSSEAGARARIHHATLEGMDTQVHGPTHMAPMQGHHGRMHAPHMTQDYPPHVYAYCVDAQPCAWLGGSELDCRKEGGMDGWGSAAQARQVVHPSAFPCAWRMLPCNAIMIQGTTQLTASHISAWRAHHDSHHGTYARQAVHASGSGGDGERACVRLDKRLRAPANPTFSSPLLSFAARVGGTSVALVTRTGSGGGWRGEGGCATESLGQALSDGPGSAATVSAREARCGGEPDRSRNEEEIGFRV